MSCCCCSWIFCLVYALSTSTTLLPHHFPSLSLCLTPTLSLLLLRPIYLLLYHHVYHTQEPISVLFQLNIAKPSQYYSSLHTALFKVYLRLSLSLSLSLSVEGAFFKKWANPASFSFILVFSNTHYNFLQQINVKNVHLVYCAGIRAHYLWNMSLFP